MYRNAKHRFKARRESERVRNLEDVLTIGNWLYDGVRLIEQNWRREVLEGETPYDPGEDKTITDFFLLWSQPARRCINEIKAFRSKGVEVRGGSQFEAAHEAVAAILRGNNPFFDDVEKAGLWAARTARYRQATRPVNVDEAGRITELSGERFAMPGLAPADVLEAIEGVRAGRTRPLREIIASRNQHGL
jgi:hypothetical protein